LWAKCGNDHEAVATGTRHWAKAEEMKMEMENEKEERDEMRDGRPIELVDEFKKKMENSKEWWKVKACECSDYRHIEPCSTRSEICNARASDSCCMTVNEAFLVEEFSNLCAS
jgi:hypothetical protein